MTVSRRKDTMTPRVLQHRIADIRGGVSVNTSELGGDFLNEGSVLSAPVNGICHVIKIATVAAEVAASAKAIKVKKGSNFKAGDFVMLNVNSAAVKISSIDETESDYDTINVATTLGAIAAGASIVEAKETSADASAFKYTPFAISGTGRPFNGKTNVDVDAWVFAVTKGLALPECVASVLKGIINY